MAIVATPLGFYFALVFIVAFGILWAPAGALICGVSARFRGLSAVRYALAGLVYSACLFLPWLYLILRIHKVPVPRFVVRIAYIVLYAFWFFGVFAVGAMFAIATAANVFRGDFPADTPPELLEQIPSPFFSSVEIAVAALNGITWLVSLIWLVRVDRRKRQQGDSFDGSPLSSPAYILPFGLTLVWFIAIRVFGFADASDAIPSIFRTFFSLF